MGSRGVSGWSRSGDETGGNGAKRRIPVEKLKSQANNLIFSKLGEVHSRATEDIMQLFSPVELIRTTELLPTESLTQKDKEANIFLNDDSRTIHLVTA